MEKKSNRNPVVLVHGIFRQSGVFRKMADYLKKEGWFVYSLNLTIGDRTWGLEDLGRELADYIEKTFPPEQPIDLIGLSMGGLVSRYYLQRLGGIQRVHRFITISTPHTGTWMAYILGCKTCLQMRPNSEFIKYLNQDILMLKQVEFTSIWTPWDFIIVPATSSILPVGKMVKLPVFTHANMVWHKSSLAAIAEALKEQIGVTL